MTLPLAELRVPHVGPDGDLAAELAKLWPLYFAYCMSVLVIGLYWMRSNFIFKLIERTDHVYNILNLAFLASVSILPFPSRAFADHLAGDRNSRTATILYVAALLAPALLWSVKWFYVVRVQLVDPRLTPDFLRHGLRLYVGTTAALTIALAVTFFHWRAGIVLAGCITLSYLFPPKPPEYRPGQEPAHELEEAEDRPRGGESEATPNPAI